MGKTLDVITIGVAIIVFGSSLTMYLSNIIGSWEIVPMFLTTLSVWIIATAGIKARTKTTPYERQPFSTAGFGLFLLAIGVSSWMYVRGFPLSYVVLTLTLIIGVLVIVAGVREWTKRKTD